MTLSRQLVTRQTKNWVKEVVIGLNLCPFASSVFDNDRIAYLVLESSIANSDTAQHLQFLADSIAALESSDAYETSLLIFPEAYSQFDDYLDFLELANHLIEELNYSGSYQLASFHPDYLFEGSTEEDAENYTNRSPYPMIHLLRESSIEKAVSSYPNIEQVPENNINKLRDIGYQVMRDKLKSITA